MARRKKKIGGGGKPLRNRPRNQIASHKYILRWNVWITYTDRLRRGHVEQEKNNTLVSIHDFIWEERRRVLERRWDIYPVGPGSKHVLYSYYSAKVRIGDWTGPGSNKNPLFGIPGLYTRISQSWMWGMKNFVQYSLARLLTRRIFSIPLCACYFYIVNTGVWFGFGGPLERDDVLKCIYIHTCVC